MSCNFGSNKRLEEMLWDRLVCGVNHRGIQRKLLSEGDVSYKDTLALAQSIEAAEDGAQMLVGSTPLQPVHFIQEGTKPSSARPPPTCYHCGGPHLAPACPHIHKVCKYCKKEGHLAKVCRAKSRAENKSDPPKPQPITSDSKPSSEPRTGSKPAIRQRPPKKEHFVQQESEPEEGTGTSDDEDIRVIHDDHSPFLTHIDVNDTPVEFEVDTGAAVSLLNESTFQSLQGSTGDLSLQPSTCKLKTYTGQAIAVLGAAPLTMRYKRKQVCLSVHVVSGTGPNLLGKDLITTLGVYLTDLKEIKSLEVASHLTELLDKHTPVFSEGLGCYNGPPVQLKFATGTLPKFHKARSVPFALKGKVEAELADLQSRGIISPVKHSPLGSSYCPRTQKECLNQNLRGLQAHCKSGCPYRNIPPPSCRQVASCHVWWEILFQARSPECIPVAVAARLSF